MYRCAFKINVTQLARQSLELIILVEPTDVTRTRAGPGSRDDLCYTGLKLVGQNTHGEHVGCVYEEFRMTPFRASLSSVGIKMSALFHETSFQPAIYIHL